MQTVAAEYQQEFLEPRHVLKILLPNSSFLLALKGNKCGDHSREHSVLVFPREYTLRVNDTWVILFGVSSICYNAAEGMHKPVIP